MYKDQKTKNYYKDRKMVFRMFPDSDLWKAEIVYNSKSKLYELYHTDDTFSVSQNPNDPDTNEDLEALLIKVSHKLREDCDGEYAYVCHCFGDNILATVKKIFETFRVKKLDDSFDFPYNDPAYKFNVPNIGRSADECEEELYKLENDE